MVRIGHICRRCTIKVCWASARKGARWPQLAQGCLLVRCSKVVSNLRYTGHQINVFVAATGHADNGRGLIPPSPSAARQPSKPLCKVLEGHPTSGLGLMPSEAAKEIDDLRQDNARQLERIEELQTVKLAYRVVADLRQKVEAE